MAKLNKKPERVTIKTHEGAKAKKINDELLLRRTVCSCLLWENEFYEDGQTISERISLLCKTVDPFVIASLAVEAREDFNLRHVPLFLVRELARRGYNGTAAVLSRVIQRADELAEFLAIYWKDGKCPLSAQVKKGLASAFTKFSDFQLAKYNKNNANIKLRDVLFLCHAKPENEKQSEDWKKLINDTLPIPETWETELSAGKDKNKTWSKLLRENKLGGLALLRNLRNMKNAGVDNKLIISAMEKINTERILPYRFIAASYYALDLQPFLEEAMFKSISNLKRLEGHTVILVDVSGSMYDKLSEKSDLERIDAACGVAMILREICHYVSIFTFSNNHVAIPSRRGFALKDSINSSQGHGMTYLGNSVRKIIQNIKDVDRLVVITDEQSQDPVPDPVNIKHSYMINVASNRNGVGYGKWIHIDGFSEAVVRWISEYELYIKMEEECQG